MTHGVIERNSDLFYWGQSGAINESIADIMGEIVDHRNVTVGGRPATTGRWARTSRIRRDPQPQQPAVVRPARQDDQPRSWDCRHASRYPDNGGVHTNTGVGNKTVYLVSQGGTFNGQTITGIDGGDAA